MGVREGVGVGVREGVRVGLRVQVEVGKCGSGWRVGDASQERLGLLN